MSIQRVCEETIRPYLVSVGETDVNARLSTIETQLIMAGVLLPAVAAELQPEDLKETGLPVPILRQLAKAIREDSLPRGTLDGDQLRPHSFDQVVGHNHFKQLMLRALLATKMQATPMAHILLTGPRGLGKTTLALAIAHEAEKEIKLLNGSQFRSATDASTQVLTWKDGDIIFIDEIHGMHRSAQETLYSVLEDHRLPITEKQRGGRVQTSVPAPRVTIIGATTNPAKMLVPFRNRFTTAYLLSFYTEAEMKQIAMRSCRVLGFRLSEEGLTYLIHHCRDNPRTLNGFLMQLSYQATTERRSDLHAQDVRFLMELNGFDVLGLQPFEHTYLETLERQGGTASLATLASAMDMEASEIEASVEPWLIRQGWVDKTSRGRRLKRTLSFALQQTETTDLEDDEAPTDPCIRPSSVLTSLPQPSLSYSFES